MAAMAAMIRKRNASIESARKAKADDDKRRNAAQALSLAGLRRRQEEGRALLLKGSAAAEEANKQAIQARLAESAVVDALEQKYGEAPKREPRSGAGTLKNSSSRASALRSLSTHASGAQTVADQGLPMVAAVAGAIADAAGAAIAAASSAMSAAAAAAAAVVTAEWEARELHAASVRRVQREEAMQREKELDEAAKRAEKAACAAREDRARRKAEAKAFALQLRGDAAQACTAADALRSHNALATTVIAEHDVDEAEATATGSQLEPMSALRISMDKAKQALASVTVYEEAVKKYDSAVAAAARQRLEEKRAQEELQALARATVLERSAARAREQQEAAVAEAALRERDSRRTAAVKAVAAKKAAKLEAWKKQRELKRRETALAEKKKTHDEVRAARRRVRGRACRLRRQVAAAILEDARLREACAASPLHSPSPPVTASPVLDMAWSPIGDAEHWPVDGGIDSHTAADDAQLRRGEMLLQLAMDQHDADFSIKEVADDVVAEGSSLALLDQGSSPPSSPVSSSSPSPLESRPQLLESSPVALPSSTIEPPVPPTMRNRPKNADDVHYDGRAFQKTPVAVRVGAHGAFDKYIDSGSGHAYHRHRVTGDCTWI